jgi:hypothetical protein
MTTTIIPLPASAVSVEQWRAGGDGDKWRPLRARGVESAQLSNLILVLTQRLSESLIDEGVGNPDVLADEPHTADPPLKLIVTAKGVNLLRRAPQKDEAIKVSTVRGKSDHVKALNFSFLLKTSPILHRLVKDL